MTLFEDVAAIAKQRRAPAGAERQVWDLPVRIFHWSLVGAFVAAYVTNRLGVAYFKYHVWAGYAVIVLVAFRLVWGLIGTRHARFWNFIRGPKETLVYARDLVLAKRRNGGAGVRHYAGHNPLGAIMVVALLVGLGAQAALGLFANDEIMNTGPLYGYVTKEASLLFTSIHRQLFYGLAGAVALHVSAVIAHRVFKNENLVRAMITGRKPTSAVAAGEAITSSRVWLAVLVGLGLALALAYVVGHAPVVDGAEF
ncbi:MAG: cytochrome b/b6 domain-containing protein [Beijerinckiaceae bacterium]|nr:cytochrome b/b6 domain-containing protein [Beijerinckiaceae bacterium]